MYVPVMKNRTVEMNVLTQLASLGVFNNTKSISSYRIDSRKNKNKYEHPVYGFSYKVIKRKFRYVCYD